MEDKLASEILKELKSNCKRNFVLFISTLILLIVSNATWIYLWYMIR